MHKDQVKWLHVESTTRCNAWCPSCPRNVNGYGLTPGLIEQDLPVDQLTTVLSTLNQLDGIQFCGNLGDPIAAANFLDQVTVSINHTKKIQIHTNGSLRNSTWWKDLAFLLKDVDHDVWFGIDGLKGIHEIYRQGTDFDRIISNAQSFISAGGNATWQFIPFKHNEHQIKDCMRLSQDLGFNTFRAVKSFRADRAQAQNWRTGEVFWLEPAEVYRTRWHQPEKNIVLLHDCMHLSQPGLYLGANGKISPCCYLADTVQYNTVSELLNTLDIKEILSNSPYATCLKNCGSCTITTLG